METNNYKRRGGFVIGIYLAATLISYLYVLYNNYYNGDFIKRDVNISLGELSAILIFTCLPILYIYYLYCRYDRRECRSISYNFILIRNITWAVIFLQICLRFSGYGTMGSDSTAMTLNPLSILRAVAYKIPVFPFVVIYTLGSKYKRGVYLTLFLFCIFSIIQKSLGGIFTSALLLVYKYPEIIAYFKRHWVIGLLLILLLPSIVTIGYQLRDTLRSGSGMAETTAEDLVAGKLCGRLSSFSSNAYIYQNIISIATVADEVPSAFFYYDPLHFFGIRPTFKSTGSFIETEIKHGKDENYSTMGGIGGVLVISAVKGIPVLIANLLFIIIVPWLLFILVKKMKLKNAAGVALFLSIWFSVNGDSSDIANNIYYLLFIWFVLQFCRRKSYAKNNLFLSGR